MRRKGIVNIAIQYSKCKAARVCLIFQTKPARKTPCASMLIEVVWPCNCTSLHSQSIVDLIACQCAAKRKGTGFHAVTMRNEKIWWRRHGFIANDAIKMTNFGADTITEGSVN